jgi:TPR repeat protein
MTPLPTAQVQTADVISLARRKPEERKPRILKRNALDHPGALTNLLDRYVHGAMVVRFCVTLAIVLSCCRLSAQALEDPQAQFNRGNEYWYGNGVPQDYAQAANWFRKSAEQGYAEAQYHLGQMLAIGVSTRGVRSGADVGRRTGCAEE